MENDNNKKELTFIVLQYNTPEETIGCVESIFDRMGSDLGWNILIVDNGSTIEDYDYILNKYKNDCFISTLRINKNVGFSKGNNEGYEFAKKWFTPEFYYFMSNDVRLLTKNLIQDIKKEYDINKFDVLGSDVLNLDGFHTSPGGFISETPKGYLSCWYHRLSSRINPSVKKVESNQGQLNRVLQGSAVLFSEKAFDKLTLPFYPETYLYHEENILSFNLFKKNMLSVYTPKIKVLHRESKTVNENVKGKLRRFIYKQRVQDKGLRVFLKYKRRSGTEFFLDILSKILTKLLKRKEKKVRK
jgi:GT2 family glycosyltransferase